MKRILGLLIALAAACGASGQASWSDGGAYFYPGTPSAPSNALIDVNDACAHVPAGGSAQNYIVVVPAGSGTNTWGAASGGAGVAYLNMPNACTLMGPGASNLTITNYSGISNAGGGLIHMKAPCIIEGLDIEPGAVQPTNYPMITLSTAANGFRVTGCVYNSGNVAVGAYFIYGNAGNSYGLIDNNIIDGDTNAEVIFCQGPTDSWQTADSFGSLNVLYIENNTFNGNAGYCTDMNANMRFVFRFNLITGKRKVDAHGADSNTPPRGCREGEIYGNSWTYNTVATIPFMELRSGTYRIFYNSATLGTSQSDGALNLTDYAYQERSSIWQNVWQTIYNGYPIDDQIGRGMDVSGNYTGPAAGDPAFLWFNTKAGAPWQRVPKNVTAGNTLQTDAMAYASGLTTINLATVGGSIYGGDVFSIPGDNQRYTVNGAIGTVALSAPGALSFTPALVNSIPASKITITDSPISLYQGQTGNPTATFVENQFIGNPESPSPNAGNNDYYAETSGQWGGTTDLTQGVSHGVTASMGTPTVPGIGYYATDQGDWCNLTAAGTTNGIQVVASGASGNQINQFQGMLYNAVGSGPYSWQWLYGPGKYPHPMVTGRSCGSALVAGHAITIYQP